MTAQIIIPKQSILMGLFMDANGIPPTFVIKSGNTNDQITFRPLEKKFRLTSRCLDSLSVQKAIFPVPITEDSMISKGVYSSSLNP